MADKIHRYHGDAIEVTYNARRCIHAAECVRGLPQVFNPQERPWITLEGADADVVAEVVLRCPTGALHYTCSNGKGEPQPEQNSILVLPDGPLYLRGVFTIQASDGTPLLQETRAAFCRCGQSANKPFCDNTHRAAGFRDAGLVAGVAGPAGGVAEGSLSIIPTANGPLLIQGALRILALDGQEVFRGTSTALCRCGASHRKPFCDGSHNQIGFSDKE